jgi:hypothetical protein
MNKQPNTSEQYDSEVFVCRELFLKKMKDYGTAWRILRHSSITDQLYIKAQRIRSIQEKGISKIDEGIQGEFIGIINYAAIGLIQLELGVSTETSMEEQVTVALYDKYIKMAKDLMSNKNHDYGEAWRDMRVSSITDLILMKILRTKQIEDNKGKTIVSEGIDANYLDMINYAVFAMIKMNEQK